MANARWYVVNVFSGSERKVAESIKEQAEKKGLQDLLLDALAPMEQIIEVKRGVKTQRERHFFPGYILVNMVLTDETWHLVSSNSKVTGFLGGRGKPTPITNAEAERLMGQLKDQKDSTKHAVIFEIAEEIRVVDGPFASFNGFVEEIDEEKERLKVSVLIFGRATPVELEFSQVEKI
ncbi:MAG: transcription termination/antitermination protein NusG [Alphaproteobacteria bacterium]|nr:transcription termination/antitermination protein NusG [Alphaproteobacteria bacterium]